MFFLFRHRLVLLGFLLLCCGEIEAKESNEYNKSPSQYVSDREWQIVRDYMLPDDHLMKEKLDQIFSRSRALANWNSLLAAGFDALPPQHHTQVIVAKHSELDGYVIKTYLDEQPYYKNKPEYALWISRIKGARLIRHYLHQHGYEHLFKAPKKWIYLLPDEPSPPPHSLRRKFILVAKDMELFDEKTNEALWGSEWVTKELLDALYQITTDLGLRDSAKPSNCSFSIDGKAAFVDTEIYQKEDVKYQKLTPYLCASMRDYWEKITANEHPSFSLRK